MVTNDSERCIGSFNDGKGEYQLLLPPVSEPEPPIHLSVTALPSIVMFVVCRSICSCNQRSNNNSPMLILAFSAVEPLYLMALVLMCRFCRCEQMDLTIFDVIFVLSASLPAVTLTSSFRRSSAFIPPAGFY